MSDERYGRGPKLSVSRVANYLGSSVTLEKAEDAVYFGKGDAIAFGLYDDGSRMREPVVRVDGIDRVNGVVQLSEKPPALALGDFIFTDPPGMQLDSPREALRQARKREVAWVRGIVDAILNRPGRGDR